MPAVATAAKNKAKSNPSNRKPPTPQVRDIGEFLARLGPILEPYGWSEGDIGKLVVRCNFDEVAIQEAVCHVLDEREGHEQGQWASIATVSEKKESVSAAKERKAQRDKERIEEAERERLRRQKVLEEEKKRHLEQAARQEAALLQKKQPGGSLVRRSGAAEARPNAWRQNKDDEPVQSESQAAPQESKTEIVQPQVSEQTTGEMKPDPQTLVGTPGTSLPNETASQTPVETLPAEQNSAWGSWEASETQTKPWTSQWATEESASWNATGPSKGDTNANVEANETISGKSKWSSDTVVMPPSFWALLGDRPLPKVAFGLYFA